MDAGTLVLFDQWLVPGCKTEGASRRIGRVVRIVLSCVKINPGLILPDHRFQPTRVTLLSQVPSDNEAGDLAPARASH